MTKKLYTTPLLETKNLMLETMIAAASTHADDTGTTPENTPSGISGSGTDGNITPGGGSGMNDAKGGLSDWDNL